MAFALGVACLPAWAAGYFVQLSSHAMGAQMLLAGFHPVDKMLLWQPAQRALMFSAKGGHLDAYACGLPCFPSAARGHWDATRLVLH